MKQVLVIGSTVVDVIISLDHLPVTGEDVHVQHQTMSLGGCAYNVSDVIRHFQVPYILFSPVGTGTYGHFVREALTDRGIGTPIPTPSRENGCCYCFVEKDGERTFISNHGAEYLFQPEWFDLLDIHTIDSVYICGLEIEEVTGSCIVDFLEAHPGLTVYFAPGPRIMSIDPALLARIFALSPILHLNESEVTAFTGKNDVKEASRALFEKTGNTVITTLGDQGAYYYSSHSEQSHISGFSAEQIDTIGAGDSHAGAVIACRQMGMSMEDAIRTANRVSAAVVETKGALLSSEQFQELHLL